MASALACASGRSRSGSATGSSSGDDDDDATIVSEDTIELDVDVAADVLLRSNERALLEIDARDVTVAPERFAVEATVDGARVVAVAVAVDAKRSKLRVSALRYGYPSLESARSVAARLREKGSGGS